MKIWKKIATGALCLCLIVPAAFAEETSEETDAITSATRQQDSSDRDSRQQSPDQNKQKHTRNNETQQDGQSPDQNSRTDQNKQRRQKPEQNIPAANGQTKGQSSQDMQTPDQNGQIPDTGSQPGQQNKKAGKTNRKEQKAESRHADQQGEGSQVMLPEKSEEEAAVTVSGNEALNGILSTLESRIEELKHLLEALIQSTSAE